MDKHEVLDLKPDDIVIPNIGKYRGQPCTVIRVEKNSITVQEWVIVTLPDGIVGLYTGEEIDFSQRPNPPEEIKDVYQVTATPQIPLILIVIAVYLLWYFSK